MSIIITRCYNIFFQSFNLIACICNSHTNPRHKQCVLIKPSPKSITIRRYIYTYRNNELSSHRPLNLQGARKNKNKKKQKIQFSTKATHPKKIFSFQHKHDSVEYAMATEDNVGRVRSTAASTGASCPSSCETSYSHSLRESTITATAASSRRSRSDKRSRQTDTSDSRHHCSKTRYAGAIASSQ